MDFSTGAFWSFSLSICFSLLLLNLVAGGKVNVPEPGSRRPFRIIGKLGNIVTSLWTGKYPDFKKEFHLGLSLKLLPLSLNLFPLLKHQQQTELSLKLYLLFWGFTSNFSVLIRGNKDGEKKEIVTTS